MSFARLVEGDEAPPDPTSPLAPRELVLESVRKLKTVDVIVLGGTIEALTLARLCALSGLRVVTFCRGTFGNDSNLDRFRFASEMISKIAAGELLQVRRGLREIESVAPDLFDWSEARLELTRGAFWLKLSKWFVPQLAASSAGRVNIPVFDAKAFHASSTLAAKQEGAMCIEHTRIASLRRLPDGVLRVEWLDELSDVAAVINAGVIFDTSAIKPSEVQTRIGKLFCSGVEVEIRAIPKKKKHDALTVSENGTISLGSIALSDLFTEIEALVTKTLEQCGSKLIAATLTNRKLPQ